MAKTKDLTKNGRAVKETVRHPGKTTGEKAKNKMTYASAYARSAEGIKASAGGKLAKNGSTAPVYMNQKTGTRRKTTAKRK